MRLFHRLLISHSLPPLILTLALGVASVALIRVGAALTTLSETELATLHDEGELHQAAWSLDVAMRHGLVACARGEDPAAVRGLVASAATRLQQVDRASGRVPPAIHNVVGGYLGAAREVVENDVCEALIGSGMQTRRSELDEQLTNLWVDRLRELHQAVLAKEDDARRLATKAASLAIPLALLSFVFAMWSARQMARRLEEPLTELARSAQRVGRGDFDTPVEVLGPTELRELAGHLDGMRRELQQIESLKQGFLASVSHELRTPLSKIREGLALLQDGALGPLDDRKLRVVQIARTACEREIRMVTTLLDLSRLRAGSPIRLSPGASVDTVLAAALESERPDAHARGVELELVTEGDSTPCALDTALLERAIANVVRNAVAVSTRGQRVTVRRRVEGAPGAGRLEIAVTDQGPGVPEAIRDKVFEAFVTRSVPNTGKAVGIGIGLSLAREVARAHGGDLSLEESQDRGTTFVLWLPLDLEVAPDADPFPPALGAGPGGAS